MCAEHEQENPHRNSDCHLSGYNCVRRGFRSGKENLYALNRKMSVLCAFAVRTWVGPNWVIATLYFATSNKNFGT